MLLRLEVSVATRWFHWEIHVAERCLMAAEEMERNRHLFSIYSLIKEIFIPASPPVGELAFAIETSPTRTFVPGCVPDESNCLFFFHLCLMAKKSIHAVKQQSCGSPDSFKQWWTFYSLLVCLLLSMVLISLGFCCDKQTGVDLLHRTVVVSQIQSVSHSFRSWQKDLKLIFCICLMLLSPEIRPWWETCTPVTQVIVENAAFLCCMSMRACAKQ